MQRDIFNNPCNKMHIYSFAVNINDGEGSSHVELPQVAVGNTNKR